MPDVAREAIWKKLLPPDRLTKDVDLHHLAAVAELSGGEIKNAVVYAVRLATYHGMEELNASLLTEAATTVLGNRWGQSTKTPAGF
jgi:hypothetical protein